MGRGGKSLIGSGIICNFHELEYPWAEVRFCLQGSHLRMWFTGPSLSEGMLSSLSYLNFLKDRLYNGVVLCFQFLLLPLSLMLFEATRSPEAELFTYSELFSIRSDIVRDHLIHRSSFPFQLESNSDPSKIGSESPIDSMGPVYLLLNLNSAP